MCLTVVVLVHKRQRAVHQIAQGVAELRVVSKNQRRLAEGKVAPVDGIAANIPSERVHRIPEQNVRKKKNEKVKKKRETLG